MAEKTLSSKTVFQGRALKMRVDTVLTEDGRQGVREMREETGFRPRKVRKLTGFYSSPGYTTEYLYLYLATDLVRDPLSAEDSAGIEVMWVPMAQIEEMIAAGKIQDSKSIAGLLFYLEYLKHGEI